MFELAPHQVADFAPRYNIAPTQDVPVIRQSAASGKRELSVLHWGLIPACAKDVKSAARMINARCETAAEKPAFRTAFTRRRCLILADGFYEWKKEGKRKVPHLFELPGSQPFAFAGLWDSWHGPDRASPTPLQSCTILTTTANEVCSPLHDRMPVIVDPTDYDDWLNAHQADADRVTDVIQSAKTCAQLTVRPVADPSKLDCGDRDTWAGSDTPLFDSLAN